MLSASDCETISVRELLEGADADVEELWRELRLSYTESRGHPALLREIARETGVSADEAIVLNPEEGIFLTLNALLDSDDHVVVLSPCYQSLYELPKSLGCEVTRWYLKKEDSVWKLDLPFLERAIKENTRLVIVNFPHNPTGFLPSVEQLNAIAELSVKKGFFVFSDEMYRGLEHNPADRLPSAPSIIRRSVALGGLSKAYGLPGLRLGWVIAPRPILAKILLAKQAADLCGSAFAQTTAERYFADTRWRRVLQDLTRAYSERRDAMIDALGDHFPAEASWTVPEGGFFVWVEMPTFLDLKSILAEAVERGVTYVPGDAFYPDGRGRNCMRLGFCYAEPAAIREGIRRLAEVLEDRLELYRAFAAAGALPAADADERG